MTHNLYREEILEHYKDPLNFGKPQRYDITSKQLNPFCGDEIEVFVTFTQEKISDIHFIGKGCAICIASASILTDYAKGKKSSELTKFTDGDMLDLINIEVSETRKKCALLGLATLRDCLH